MPTQKKAEMIEQIKEEFGSAAAIFLVDYKGLTVKAAEELRGKLREAGAEMKVYKNTLARIALREDELPEVDSLLVGPSAFIVAKEDPAAPAKALKEFAAANKAIVIKGGIMEGSVLTVDEVMAVAELPSREQLVGNLIQVVRTPLTQLVRVLNGPNEKIVRTLSLIAKDQESAA